MMCSTDDHTRRPCIGVFDSGFGGLTVLKELDRSVPEADYLYFGDTARLPYGSKSAETVARYAVGAAQYLEQHGAQMLVIACNTATALALERSRRLPAFRWWVWSSPGGARRCRQPKSAGSWSSAQRHGKQPCLFEGSTGPRGPGKEKACPLLVPLVEEGWTEHSGHRTGGPDLSRRGLRRRLRVCGRSGAGLHSLSAAKPLLHGWRRSTSRSWILPTPPPVWSASTTQRIAQSLFRRANVAERPA